MSNINPIGTVTTMTDQSTLVIEHWQTSRLIPYVRNPRKNDHAVEQMAGAITEFGFRIPLIAKSNGELVDGHLRLKAALHLGLDTVPVILADDLTPAQIKAFRLLANRSATWAQWDDDLLRLELDDLKLEDFDLTLTGFDPDELAALLADGEEVQSGNNDDDLVPDLSEEPITKPGDLWLLGPHRLLCGDSTTPANVRRLLGNAVPILMVSDPPYGVRYDPGWRNDAGVSSTARIGAVMNDDRADWSEAWALCLLFSRQPKIAFGLVLLTVTTRRLRPAAAKPASVSRWVSSLTTMRPRVTRPSMTFLRAPPRNAGGSGSMFPSGR